MDTYAEWKDIPGKYGLEGFQASFDGRIRRIGSNGNIRLLKPFRKKKKRGLFVRVTMNGKRRDFNAATLVALAYLGIPPPGMVVMHRNEEPEDNLAGNLVYVPKSVLGRRTGGRSRRRTVVQLNEEGEEVAFYFSARAAARQNYMSHQTVTDYCNGNVKGGLAPDGHAYAWADSAASIRRAKEKLAGGAKA